MCNLVYALVTAEMDDEQRDQFDVVLNNPRGAHVVAQLRSLGVA